MIEFFKKLFDLISEFLSRHREKRERLDAQYRIAQEMKLRVKKRQEERERIENAKNNSKQNRDSNNFFND